MNSSWSLSAPLFSTSDPEMKSTILYDNKNYSTEEERQKFFDKIKSKQKTELCKNYELYHVCPHGNNCSFAHGEKELRNTSDSLFCSYKSKKCKMFKRGFCIFGSRCNYIHRVKEKRYFSYTYLLNRMAQCMFSELKKYENKSKDPWVVYKILLSKKQIIT